MSARKRSTSTHPQLPTPDPEEGVNPRLPDADLPGEEKEEEHVESDEEQQARESEAALDRAATRLPPD
jgi:hypothetical protein